MGTAKSLDPKMPYQVYIVFAEVILLVSVLTFAFELALTACMYGFIR